MGENTAPEMGEPRDLGQYCTCDVENYGDLLYPPLLARLLKLGGCQRPVDSYAFLPGPAPCGADYSVQSLKKRLRIGTGSAIDLIIGGGDILRSDRHKLASHYLNARNPEACGPISRFLRSMGMERSAERWFCRRFMPERSIGPFLLDKKAHKNIRSLCYMSIGVPFSFSERDCPYVSEAVESADFVYVRDRQSCQKLLDSGVRRPIHVAPDLAVCISDAFDRDRLVEEGRKIIEERLRMDAKYEFLCFQISAAYRGRQLEVIAEALSETKRATGYEIVMMPLAYCHGDDVALNELEAIGKGVWRYIDTDSIYGMMAVIAASRGFLGTSMHGNITAFSLGLPFLFTPIGVDKIQGFLDIVGLDVGRFVLKEWREAPEKMVQSMNSAAELTERLKTAKAQVWSVLHSLVRELLRGPGA